MTNPVTAEEQIASNLSRLAKAFPNGRTFGQSNGKAYIVTPVGDEVEVKLIADKSDLSSSTLWSARCAGKNVTASDGTQQAPAIGILLQLTKGMLGAIPNTNGVVHDSTANAVVGTLPARPQEKPEKGADTKGAETKDAGTGEKGQDEPVKATLTLQVLAKLLGSKKSLMGLCEALIPMLPENAKLESPNHPPLEVNIANRDFLGKHIDPPKANKDGGVAQIPVIYPMLKFEIFEPIPDAAPGDRQFICHGSLWIPLAGPTPFQVKELVNKSEVILTDEQVIERLRGWVAERLPTT